VVEGHEVLDGRRGRNEVGLRLREGEGATVIRRTGVDGGDVAYASRFIVAIVGNGADGFGEGLCAGSLPAAEFEDTCVRANGGAPCVDEVDSVDGLGEFNVEEGGGRVRWADGVGGDSGGGGEWEGHFGVDFFLSLPSLELEEGALM